MEDFGLHAQQDQPMKDNSYERFINSNSLIKDRASARNLRQQITEHVRGIVGDSVRWVFPVGTVFEEINQ